MILAGIDIGTNTLRLLIADTSPDFFREIHSDRKITCLGERIDRTGMLSAEAQERTISVLSTFRRSIGLYPVAGTAAVGTSALRNAGNAAGFIAAARERTGLAVQVVSGTEEAELTLLGVMKALKGCPESAVPKAVNTAVVIDIGGGSTEIIPTGREADFQTASVPLGAVYLTERFIKRDPPSAVEIESLRSCIRNELDGCRLPVPGSGTLLVGTAGTVTTLAAIDRRLEEYDPDKINCSVLTFQAIDRIIERLRVMTVTERRKIIGLERGREDIILAGAIVCREVMERLGFPSLVVTDWGLREGIIFDLYDRLGKGKGSPDLNRTKRAPEHGNT